MIRRGFRYRLSPTPEQEAKFNQFAGVCRLVYNLALEQRINWFRQFRQNHGRNISWVSQSAEVTQLRAQYDWIAAVYATCLGQVVRDLDAAFMAFFRGRAGYPKFRKRGDDSFRFKGIETSTKKLNAKWSAVRVPKIGWVKFRDTRPREGRALNVTVSRNDLGWHVSFACEIECAVPQNELPSVGIDRGVANTLMLSTGEAMGLPPSLDALDDRYRSAQRVVSRRKKGSRRQLRAVRRAAKIAARRARIRRDWQHRVSTDIARRFGTVVIEDLKIKNMTAKGRGKRGLNRSILNQSWGAFATILAYKLEERGGELVAVNPAFTSQQCSSCGTIDKANRESQAVFACQHCGFAAHADQNAAVNILRRSTPSMRAEGVQYAPVETRTDNLALVRGC